MKYLFSIFFFHFFFHFFGQITYTKKPLDLQLVARDKTTNLGNVNIEGNVDILSDFQYLRVGIYRNDVLLNTVDQSLVYSNSKATFVFNISIPAELANYSFKIYGYQSSSGNYILDKTISNIVAGDTYIIQGQSNAVAMKRSGTANGNKSDFIRVYASGTPSADSLLANDAWYIADGDGASTSNGNAGQWGLKLAKLLVDNLRIPIAVFNGANGAQVITFFKAPQDYKTSQNSNYGRLYYRLKKTGLENNVRAFFWSQGEANSGSGYISIQNYKSAFKSIESSYLKDYPNIEKFYIFQIKDMICSDKTYEGKMNVKEAQRQLASESDEIDIISTTSLSLYSDSCHFPFVNGYEEFAKRVYKLVLQDIYGKSYIEEIRSPMIKSAEFTQPNTLVLETDAKELKFSSTDQITMLTRIKQDFELRNAQSVTINNVNLLENKIIFTLSGDPGPIANISFVGYNSNIGYTVTNSSDLELICFRNFPIKNFSYNGGDNSNYPIIENTSICNTIGSNSTIAVLSPNATASYKWLYKIPNGDWIEITNLNAGTVYLNYNTPILEIIKTSTLPVTGTLYRVVASYGVLGNFTSNESTLTVDSAPVSKSITGASTICSDGSKTLTYGSDSVGTIQWQYSIVSNQENFIDIDEENGLTYTANNLLQNTWYRVMNSNGVCSEVFSTAIQVVVVLQPVAGNITGGNVSVCKTNNSTILSLNNYVGNIRWQKATTLSGSYSNISSATLPSYTASGLTATTYYRAVLSNGICISQMTEPVAVYVDPLAVSKTISGSTTICAGESVNLSYGTGSVGTIQWQYSITSSLDNFIDLEGENGLIYTAYNLQKTTWFKVKNSSGVCSETYSNVIQITVNPKSVAGYISGGNVSVCKTSNSTVLSLKNYDGDIQWQKSSSLTGTYSSIFTETSNTYTASSLSATTYYRVILTKGNCPAVITEPVGIFISQVAVAKTISGATTICSGESRTLSYGLDSVGVIQWQYSIISSTTGFNNIINENGITYTPSNITQNTWYRVMNTIGSCSTVYSPAVQIVINPKAIAGFISGGGINFCSASSATTLSLNNYFGSIQWQKATSLTGTYSNISSATLSSYNVSSLTATTYFRAVLSSGVCTPQITEPVAIIVNPLAIAKTISGSSSICIGKSVTLSYGIGSVGAIQWQSSTTSSSTNFTDILGANGLDYTPDNQQQTTWFRVKNTNGVCPVAYSVAFQVIVYSTPPPVGDSIQLFNFNTPVFVSNLIATGSNVKWYSTISDALTNSNPLGSTNTITLGSTYYAMQSLDGCFSTYPLTVTVTNSLDNTEFKIDELEFYPNPFKNLFILKYSKIITSVELYNYLGQSVFKTSSDDKEVTLDVNFLPSGIYFIQIVTNDKKTLIKGIKL